jgi:hypothetical protein
MNYVRRQRAGAKEFGDRIAREHQADYDFADNKEDKKE